MDYLSAMNMPLYFYMLWHLFWVPPQTTACKNYYSAALKQKVYTTVDNQPTFPGGEAAYQRFLNKKLGYPAVDSTDLESLQSVVKFKFIVDTNGSIRHMVMLHSNERSTPLEKEVLRVFALMPKWEPGKCNGKTVATELIRSMVVCYGSDE